MSAAPEFGRESSGRWHASVSNDAVGVTSHRRRRRGGTARRLRVGLKDGPGTAARLKAGSYEERFACLFQAHAVFSHQVCAAGSVFFRRRLPKAGLSESTQHIRLILDPSPSLNLRSFN